MQLLIPAAGEGVRFQGSDGIYTSATPYEPKPFMKVLGKPMVQHVIDSIYGDNTVTLLLQHKHLVCMPNLGRVSVIPVYEKTAGPGASVLLAEPFIDPERPLMLATCDQFIRYDITELHNRIIELHGAQEESLLFLYKNPALHPKRSYAKVFDGRVLEVRERDPFTEDCIVGVYYFTKAKFCFNALRWVVANNIRHDDEVFISPLYNFPGMGTVRPFFVEMYDFGTPEALAASVERLQQEAG